MVSTLLSCGGVDDAVTVLYKVSQVWGGHYQEQTGPELWRLQELCKAFTAKYWLAVGNGEVAAEMLADSL